MDPVMAEKLKTFRELFGDDVTRQVLGEDVLKELASIDRLKALHRAESADWQVSLKERQPATEIDAGFFNRLARRER